MIIMVNSDSLQKSPWHYGLLGGKLFGLRVVWPGHSACWLFSFWAWGITLLGPFGIKVGIVNFVPQRKESKRFPHINKISSLGEHPS
jgi:hypothetical protein